jgi:hypothetical protein
LPVDGEVKFDLYAIYIRGRDAFGKKFNIALEDSDARELIFKLHRIILEQQKSRNAVNKAHDGGKVA